jgi:hypothetical protein
MASRQESELLPDAPILANADISSQGISMSLEQYSALIGILPQIENALKMRGEDVPRPKYGEQQTLDTQIDNSDDEDQSKKANIEATSDEEE